MTTPSIISDVEKQVRSRIEELRPLVDEYEQLQEVLRTFERSRQPGGGTLRSRRRRGADGAGSSGQRAQQALELVKARPGITVAELADEMGIGPTYLYRVMPALEREQRVTKVGKGYELSSPS